jgi:hypothetical protein
MNFAGEKLIPTFYKAFSHLDQSSKKDNGQLLTLYFFDSETTGVFVNEAPWRNEPPHHLGFVESFSSNGFYALQQPGSGAIYMLDKNSNEGLYYITSSLNIPWWEGDFPLRMFFHWWLKDSAYQPVHAGAVGTDKGGVLLIGKGGSGKSTTTVFCIDSKLKVAGDDYVLIDSEEKYVYSLFSLTKLTKRSLELLTNLAISAHELPEPKEDKYRIDLFPRYQDSLIRKMPVVATLLPEITTNEFTTIEACTAGDAMRALAPTTLFQLPGLRAESFAKMSLLVREVPNYRLKLGKDSSRVPDILHEFITRLTKILHP